GMHVVFAPDGKTVFSSTLGIDHHVRQWEAATGKEVKAFPTEQDNSSGLAVSPDGQTLYCVTLKGAVQAWEGATGKTRRQLGKPGNALNSLCLSADGRRLACALFDGVYVWDTATGRELWKLPKSAGSSAQLAFAPDGWTLATADQEDDRVRLWEMATGRL